MRYKVGSNQFRKKRKNRLGLVGAYIFWALIIGYFLCQCAVATQHFIHNADVYLTNASYKLVHGELINPVIDLNPKIAIVKKVEASDHIVAANKLVQPSTDQENIEKYIHTIFGSDARIAIAISHNECSPHNASYPACILHTPFEYSVGIFQINLYNTNQWIHAARVPGKTMEEKVAWLKDPYNNTLYAYWVFKTSGFSPWSTYANGAYLNDL